MKKIVRLTESDLVRLVKRVINEQQMGLSPCLGELLAWATKEGGVNEGDTEAEGQVKSFCGALEKEVKSGSTTYKNQKACVDKVYGMEEGETPAPQLYRYAQVQVSKFIDCLKGTSSQM
jgi:hypothetical protein